MHIVVVVLLMPAAWRASVQSSRLGYSPTLIALSVLASCAMLART
jgi:hypothetical protein